MYSYASDQYLQLVEQQVPSVFHASANRRLGDPCEREL